MVDSFPCSRRGLLHAVGAGLLGSVAMPWIAACSQQPSSGSTPSASQYVRSDFSGEVTFDHFDTSAGTYVLATAEHPAKNIPIPLKTEGMSKGSIVGFYETIGYLSAALNYLLLTGDDTPLGEIHINPEFTKIFLLFTDEAGESAASKSWYISPQVTLSLDSSMPATISDHRKDWGYELNIHVGDQQVVNAQASPISEDQQNLRYSGTIQGTFEAGVWSLAITTTEARAKASASPTSS